MVAKSLISNIGLQLTATTSIVTVSGNSVLTDLSFGMETCISNLLGRGAFAFEFERTRLTNGDGRVTFNTLVPSGPSAFSMVASLANAAQAKIVPKAVLHSFQSEVDSPEQMKDGPHQHQSSSFANTSTSVLKFEDLNANQPLSVLAYGLCDLIMGFFALGSTYGKYQISLKTSEFLIRHNLSNSQLEKFLRSNNYDYDINRLVKTL